jgi:hypothetical protein
MAHATRHVVRHAPARKSARLVDSSDSSHVKRNSRVADASHRHRPTRQTRPRGRKSARLVDSSDSSTRQTPRFFPGCFGLVLGLQVTAYARRICLASSTSPTRLVSNVSRVDPGAGSLPPSPPSPDHPTSGSCRSRIVDATRALVERRSCHLRMMACMVRFEPQGSFSRCGCTPFRLKAGGVAQTHEERGRQGRSTIDRARRVQPRSLTSRRVGRTFEGGACRTSRGVPERHLAIFNNIV